MFIQYVIMIDFLMSDSYVLLIFEMTRAFTHFFVAC